MRHSNSGKKLSRTPSHRKALFRNMTKALLAYGKIRTTETKAMALRGVVEPLIALTQRNDLHARREAYKLLGSHQMVKTLFDEIGPKFVGISGGFTRVTKLGMPRPGDCAPLAVIELLYADDRQAKAAKPAPVVAEPKMPRAEKAAPVEAPVLPASEPAPVVEAQPAEVAAPASEESGTIENPEESK